MMLFCLFEAGFSFSLLCSDIFRDYEADYSATLSAEEPELQAEEEEEEGGWKQREADEDEDDDEEGIGTLTRTWHESSFSVILVLPHPRLHGMMSAVASVSSPRSAVSFLLSALFLLLLFIPLITQACN